MAILKRHVFALALGNALAFYDFVTYAFFAVQIGRAFFPAISPNASLLAALATFGSGFLTRPLGAVVIGNLADRVGRRPATLLSFGLLGAAVTGLALTPTYARIGILAPLLAITFRLLQGFAIGGEVGPSTVLLLEAAPLHQRGLYVSLLVAGSDFAVLVAGVTGYVLSTALTPAALDAWGWRVALLLGIAILPLGAQLRLSLPETLVARAAVRPPFRAPALVATRLAAIALVMLGAGTISGYGLDYLTTYAETTLRLPADAAFGATIVVGLCGVICGLLGGWLSDRHGRKPLLVLPFALLLLGTIPAFLAFAHVRTRAMFWAVSALLACATALPTGVGTAAIGEALPHGSRARNFGLLYSIAVSIFGGSTQLILAWLIMAGGALAPAVYMTGAALIGLSAILCFPETLPKFTGSAPSA